MKRFRCGDVVPACPATFVGHEDEILAQVGAHARDDHGIGEPTPELVLQVRAAMVPA